MVPILGSFSRGVKEDDEHICRLNLNMNSTLSGNDILWHEATKEREILVTESKAA